MGTPYLTLLALTSRDLYKLRLAGMLAWFNKPTNQPQDLGSVEHIQEMHFLFSLAALVAAVAAASAVPAPAQGVDTGTSVQQCTPDQASVRKEWFVLTSPYSEYRIA
jgi:hypothetical protein